MNALPGEASLVQHVKSLSVNLIRVSTMECALLHKIISHHASKNKYLCDSLFRFFVNIWPFLNHSIGSNLTGKNWILFTNYK